MKDANKYMKEFKYIIFNNRALWPLETLVLVADVIGRCSKYYNTFDEITVSEVRFTHVQLTCKRWEEFTVFIGRITLHYRRTYNALRTDTI